MLCRIDKREQPRISRRVETECATSGSQTSRRRASRISRRVETRQVAFRLLSGSSSARISRRVETLMESWIGVAANGSPTRISRRVETHPRASCPMRQPPLRLESQGGLKLSSTLSILTFRTFSILESQEELKPPLRVIDLELVAVGLESQEGLKLFNSASMSAVFSAPQLESQEGLKRARRNYADAAVRRRRPLESQEELKQVLLAHVVKPKYIAIISRRVETFLTSYCS